MDDTLKSRFWSLLYAAIQKDPKPKLVFFSHNEARLLFSDKRLFVILLDERPEERRALEDWAKVLVHDMQVKEIDVVVIGASDAIDQTLAEAHLEVPWTRRLAVGTLHEDGRFREITNKQFDGFARAVIESAQKMTLSEGSIAEMKAAIKAFYQDDRKQVSEVAHFQRKLSLQGDAATYALLLVIIFFFIIQSWVGGATYGPALVRMGANAASFVHQGEYWRLMTSVFLHGGLLHVAANCYVLYALGVFFNRIIGNARFITLFLFSGLFGSLSSVLIGGADLSVGASGALWGLFGLSGALIVRPSHFMPDRIRHSMRRITLINLVINLGISFLPMVDLWAHLGGGVAGFVLGLYYVYQGENPKYRWLNTATALAFMAITATAMLVNAAKEQPWRLLEPIHLTTRALQKARASIGIPDVVQTQKQEQTSSVYGDLRFDPYQITVNFAEGNDKPQTKEDTEKLLVSSLRGTLDQLGLQSAEIRVRDIGGFQSASTYVKMNDGVRFWVWFQMRGKTMISVDIVASPDTPTLLTQNLDQIIESLSWPSP